MGSDGFLLHLRRTHGMLRNVSNWAWVLFGGAVTLPAAIAVVILWQAFKHLDLKIERRGNRLDAKIDRLDKKLGDQRNYVDKKFDDQRN